MWLIIISVFIAIVAISVIIYAYFKKHNFNTGESATSKKQKPLSYKQQMYKNSLMGDETSPYSVATYILSQSAYDAYSDFVKDLFGYQKGSKDSETKIFDLIKKYHETGSIKVLPDGHKDITFPRTSTKFLDRTQMITLVDFIKLKNGNILFFYHNEKNCDLSKQIDYYCKKHNIEIKYAPKISGFSSKTNKYIELNPDSEECAFIYYLCLTEGGVATGFKSKPIPSLKTVNQYKAKVMKDYNFRTDYEFMSYLISHFICWYPFLYSFHMMRIPRLETIFVGTRPWARSRPDLLTPLEPYVREKEKLLSEMN